MIQNMSGAIGQRNCVAEKKVFDLLSKKRRKMSGKRGREWTELEVGRLCLALLQVGEDASVGTGQKADVFWRLFL